MGLVGLGLVGLVDWLLAELMFLCFSSGWYCWWGLGGFLFDVALLTHKQIGFEGPPLQNISFETDLTIFNIKGDLGINQNPSYEFCTLAEDFHLQCLCKTSSFTDRPTHVS